MRWFFRNGIPKTVSQQRVGVNFVFYRSFNRLYVHYGYIVSD